MIEAGGTGTVVFPIGTDNAAMEWDIYQISVTTTHFSLNCYVEIFANGFYLCGTPQGSRDTATGPPDVIVGASDDLIVVFTGVPTGDWATVGIWYNENPTGTTRSTAH